MAKYDSKQGSHDKRNRLATRFDPYHTDAGMKEPCVCLGCKSVYQHRSWHLDPAAYTRLADSGEASWVQCPACRKVAERYAEGMLTLQGSYLWDHEQEIRNILRNEAERVMQRNPLERIMRLERVGDSLVIETTEEKLVEHLGKALHRAHRGTLDIRWDDRKSLCRVTWERQE
jgi:hypothetical protein